jgi:glucose/mannose transport system permease protein
VVSIYYILPLWVMVDDLAQGDARDPHGQHLRAPRGGDVPALGQGLAEACTGLKCDGLSAGFWNSVRILIPSVAISIAVASVSGYALSMWKFKGSETFFTILLLGAFIPYQVMLYPIVILLREMGLYGSLWGSCWCTRCSACRSTRCCSATTSPRSPRSSSRLRAWTARVLGHLLPIMLPMSLPIFVVSMIIQITGIWNDFLFGVIYTSNERYPMTVQLNNIVNAVQGAKEYNVNMAATLLTGLVPLSSTSVRQALRARHRRGRRERLTP